MHIGRADQAPQVQVRFSKAIAAIVGVVLAKGAGYWFGQRVERRAWAKHHERLQTENISNVVGAIYLLDMGDVPGTRRALLGLASGSLDGVMENWDASSGLDPEYRAARCKVLGRLKNLRAKHNFLGNPEDEVLRSDPEIASAEARRRSFLESVQCDMQQGHTSP